MLFSGLKTHKLRKMLGIYIHIWVIMPDGMNFIGRVETLSNAYNFEDSAAEHGSTFGNVY